MFKSADRSLIRSTNQRLILDTIYRDGASSRANLARMLSLSKPAIADNLDILLKLGIVREIGEGKADKKGGRKPILIEFYKNHRYILAIDLNFKDPIFALGNLCGEIQEEFSVKVSSKATTETRISLIKNAINLLLNAHNIQPDKLCSIVISSPGVFHDTQKIYANQQFSFWFEGNIFSTLSKEYDTPVFFQNDANTAAIGEWIYGAGKGVENMLYLSCGLGVGAGLILNAQLFEGQHSAAGEIYSNIDPAGLKNKKNLEGLISISAMLDRVKEDVTAGADTLLRQSDPQMLDFEDIIQAYQQNDSYLLNLIEEICIQIGCIISNIANLLTIETVVLGGEYVVFREPLLRIVEQIVRENCHFPPRVLISQLDKYAGIYGLFGIARDKYFDQISQGGF